MQNTLLLLSGNDIPFPAAQVTIHQPTLKEIAYISEENFFIGTGFLNFSKKMLDTKDKDNLINTDDFDIFMTILISNKKEVKKTVNAALLVLSLIFPLYTIEVRKDSIVLKQEDKEYFINKLNFSAFKEILSAMFVLDTNDSSNDYNPQGTLAKKIAEKLKQGQERLSKLKHNVQQGNFNILGRYASILAVGLQKDLNNLMQYTVYQLYDEFQRFQLKLQWDGCLQAKMAGAKDVELVDNWMIDLKDQGKAQKQNNNKIKN